MSGSMYHEGGCSEGRFVLHHRQSDSTDMHRHSVTEILGLVKSTPTSTNSPDESYQVDQLLVPAEAPAMTTPAIPTLGVKRSRRRRARTNYTPLQLAGLEKLFASNRYPGINDREALADSIDLSEARIQVWFQNSRARLRRGGQDLVGTTSLSGSSSLQAVKSIPRSKDTKPSTSSSPRSSPTSTPSPCTSDVSLPSSLSPSHQYLQVCTQACCVTPGTQYLPSTSYSYHPWAAYQSAGYHQYSYIYPGASSYCYEYNMPLSAVTLPPTSSVSKVKRTGLDIAVTEAPSSVPV